MYNEAGTLYKSVKLFKELEAMNIQG